MLLAAPAMQDAMVLAPQANGFDALAERVLAGEVVSRDDALAILGAPAAELRPLLHAAFRVREHYHGRRVKICQLRNARQLGLALVPATAAVGEVHW